MTWDAVVVGSGPNGLAAAVALAQRGASVLVLEARDTLGGGTRTAALTLPGFAHDVCSAAHPMGILSPFLRQLPLERFGLTWATGSASFAHPLDGEPAVCGVRSMDAMVDDLGEDGPGYRRMLAPFLADPHGFLGDALAPLRWPRDPLRLARFGLLAIRSAQGLARSRFRGERARALLAGCAAHSILPLDRPLSAAVGVLFALTAHIEDWPVARGGSASIAAALAGYLRSLGGTLEVGRPVRSLSDLPPSRVVLFDTSPDQLASIGGDSLPARYRRRLLRYRYGPGTYKVDWALDGPIPWSDGRVRGASTVHCGGTLAQIAEAERAAWDGRAPERPFVMVVQQSELDPTRAPTGQHTGYGYCHVPAGWEGDATDAIEAQIERFAPGFRDRILARHRTSPSDLHAHNANYVGGAIAGGVADLGQLFFRPVARLDPYSTPNPRLFLCSASTPPGGGVHGMCGYWAARSAARRLGLPRA
jgi:phytoene dehydrogenase-like protein